MKNIICSFVKLNKFKNFSLIPNILRMSQFCRINVFNMYSHYQLIGIWLDITKSAPGMHIQPSIPISRCPRPRPANARTTLYSKRKVRVESFWIEIDLHARSYTHILNPATTKDSTKRKSLREKSDSILSAKRINMHRRLCCCYSFTFVDAIFLFHVRSGGGGNSVPFFWQTHK